MTQRMLRGFLAMVVGAVVGNFVFLAGGVVSNAMYPTPPELMDPQTPEETAARVDAAQTGGLVLVVLGSAIGGLAAGASAGYAARRQAVLVAVALAVLLSLSWGVYSFYVFYPERLWFPAGLFAGFLLFTPVGGFVSTLWPSRPQRRTPLRRD